MMELIKGIASGAPVWVWPMFLGLMAIGLYSTRQRVSPVWVFYLIPLLGISTVKAVSGLATSPEIWGLFVASYAAGAVMGWRLQPRWIIGRDLGRVALKGEMLTLAVIIVVFAANFVVGTVQAIAPHVAAAFGFQIGFVMVAGIAAGSFLGRTVAIIVAPRDRLPA